MKDREREKTRKVAAKICEVPDYQLKMRKLVKNLFEEKK
jgi:hypothetical protein